jgi:hypothetical protein
MKKLLAFSTALCLAVLTFAGGDFHAYRTALTEPSYGLAKVKKMVNAIRRDRDENRRLSSKQFNALTLPETFTYVMVHGEDFSQNCNVMPAIKAEDKKIFAYPAEAFGDETVWSDRQTGFLKKNRSQIIKLIRETIQAQHRVGANLKAAIIELNAREMVPDLISAYQRDRRDNDVLTVLMLLMKQGDYQPFMYTPIYMKLYGDENASYQEYLESKPANVKTILDNAQLFSRKR